MGLPFSGSSAISKELIEYYDGKFVYGKHANIQSCFRDKEIDVKEYFVFAVYRDPVDICKTIYSKYVNNANGHYTEKKYLVENGGHIQRKDVDLFHKIQGNNIKFNEFLKLKSRGFLPYDNVYSINEEYLDFTIQFSELNKNFTEVLEKLNLVKKRDLPQYNKTKGRIVPKESTDKKFFEPFYLRNESLWSASFTFNRMLYFIVHPIRKYKWLKMDKLRSDAQDEYFSKY